MSLAQLRGVLAAEQSAEVAQEHEHRRTLVEEVAEAPLPPLGVAQSQILQRAHVHAHSVDERLP